MRQPYKKQITIGSKNIKEIEFDLNCWHEIIPILMGLQRIYKTRKLPDEILDLIKQDVLVGKSEKHGTQGLCYWEILISIKTIEKISNLVIGEGHTISPKAKKG